MVALHASFEPIHPSCSTVHVGFSSFMHTVQQHPQLQHGHIYQAQASAPLQTPCAPQLQPAPKSVSLSHHPFGDLTTCLCRGLSGLGLEGEIPPEGWELPSTLLSVDLSSNALNGSLPELWTLPPSLSSLELSGNSLSGELSRDLLNSLLYN